MNHHVFAIPTATVLFENRREIGLVSVANDHATITIVVHKQAARETRGTIHMDKLTQCSGSIRLCVEMGMVVEVATDTGVTTTARSKTLIWLELPSDHKIMHMQLELRHGIITRMTQAAMPNIQWSRRSGFGGANRGNHSRSHKS